MSETVDDMRKRALTREDLLLNPSSPYGNLQQVLGTTESDVGTICVNPNINMMSKCKPIKYDTAQELTTFQRIGMASENNVGYYYGVKVVAGSTLSDIHSIDYDYSKPTGAPYYYRLTDFIGYHHKAVPNVDATIVSDKLYIDISNNLQTSFDVDYLNTNTTGIDLKAAFAAMASNQDQEYVFARIYPIIAIGNKISVLKNADGVVQPIFYQDTWQRTFYADLSTGGFSEGTYPVTLGFMFRKSGSGATFPIDGSWVEIDGINEADYTEKVIVAYSAHNLQKTLERYQLLAPKATPAFNAFVSALYVSYTFESTPASDIEVTAYVKCGGMQASKSQIYSTGGGAISLGIDFNWKSDFGMVVSKGAMVNVECYLTTRYTDYTIATTGTTVKQTVTVQ